MDIEDSEPLEFGRAQPKHYGAALWLATGGRSLRTNRGRVTALLAAEKQGQISFDGLLIASRGNRVVGAVWCFNQPGRIATVWGPGLIPTESESIAEQLVQQVMEFASSAGSHLVQSLVDAENPTAGELLTRGGFRSITYLNHLQAFPEEVGLECPSATVSFVPCENFRRSEFQQLVSSTYEGSLDCPEVDGLRDIEDVLDGYYATCNQSARHWYRIQYDGELAGVTILGHHSAVRQLELIYFGLLPHCRRHGLGGEIMRFVMHMASRLGCESVVTGVDQRNVPAMALYRRFGFHLAESKELFLLPLKPRTVAVA